MGGGAASGIALNLGSVLADAGLCGFALMRGPPQGCKDPQVISVLIVDDWADFRAVARVMLESGGYQVVGEAASGAEALAAVAAVRPQVVLLDVGLPDMDGFTVSCELRRLFPATVVVLWLGQRCRRFTAPVSLTAARTVS
jgi:CheY-like chemotaxis protein